MPALVNNKVGSLVGRRGLERTRVCPWRSKYCKNFSRISLPFMIEWSLACVTKAGEFEGMAGRKKSLRLRCFPLRLCEKLTCETSISRKGAKKKLKAQRRPHSRSGYRP